MASLRTRTSQSDLSVQDKVFERWQPANVLVDLGMPELDGLLYLAASPPAVGASISALGKPKREHTLTELNRVSVS